MGRGVRGVPCVPDRDLQVVWQRAELSPTAAAQTQSLLLGFELVCPGQGQRGAEEDPGLQAPVGWILRTAGRSDGRRSDAPRGLEEEQTGSLTTVCLKVDRSETGMKEETLRSRAGRLSSSLS